MWTISRACRRRFPSSRRRRKNPRSTVGTVTEIHDYLRLLFARAGTPYSPATGLPIEAQQVQDMVDRVMALPEGTRAYLLAPIVRDRKGEYRKEMLDLRKQGFQRVKVDGAFHDLDTRPTLDKKFRHDIDVVVDRIVVRDGIETRLADSFRTALDLAQGIAVLELAERPRRGPRAWCFQREFRLPRQWLHHPEIEPRLFSFNAPFGACPACDGLGVELFFDERWWCRTSAAAGGRRHRALAQGQIALFPADHRGAGRITASMPQPLERPARARAQVLLYGSTAKRNWPFAMTRGARL
jgi:excinuclease UvrABC ATPase subunit